MSSRNLASGLAVGFVLGTAIELAVGLLYAPRPGEETRRILRDKAEEAFNPIKKTLFRLRWMTMSLRERYSYLWAKGGSLREWRGQYATPEQPDKGGQPV